MVASRDRALPERALQDAKHRILDTVAAMVSGSALPPGVAATRFIRSQGGVPGDARANGGASAGQPLGK